MVLSVAETALQTDQREGICLLPAMVVFFSVLAVRSDVTAVVPCLDSCNLAIGAVRTVTPCFSSHQRPMGRKQHETITLFTKDVRAIHGNEQLRTTPKEHGPPLNADGGPAGRQAGL